MASSCRFNFLTFFFCPTGDTDALSGNVVALAEREPGDRFSASISNSDRASGLISIFVLGDAYTLRSITYLRRRSHIADHRRPRRHSPQRTQHSGFGVGILDQRIGAAIAVVALGRDATSNLRAKTTSRPACMSREAIRLRIPSRTEADLFNARAFLTRQQRRQRSLGSW